MLRKIISGGQTGADQVGLDFAIGTGLKHGGYFPRAARQRNGRIDDRYNLVELSTSSYPARTRSNGAKCGAPLLPTPESFHSRRMWF